MKRILLILFVFLIINSCAKSNRTDINKLNPPVAMKKAHITEMFDMKLYDDYFWMRYLNDNVIEHIKRENAYTDEIMKKNQNIIEVVYKEMIGRLKEDDLSVPYRMGNYIYYFRTEKGKQYPIYLRKKVEENVEEELLIDVNEMSDGFTFYDIGEMQVSPDEKLLMFLIDTTGNEKYSLHILNIETRKITDEGITNISSVEWASNSRILYYTLENEASRPYKVMRHEIFTNANNDKELFREENDKYWIWLSKSKDDEYIFIGVSSKLTSYMMYIAASDTDGTFEVVKEQEEDVEYYVEHHNGIFYIMTNEDAFNYKICYLDVDKLTDGVWETFIKEDSKITIENIYVFKNFMVLQERKNGSQALEIIDFKTNKRHYLNMAEETFSFWISKNPEFDTDLFRFTYSSFITPSTVYDYDMAKMEFTTLKEREILGGYNKNDYTTKQIDVLASDGELIPVSIVYKKGIKMDGSSPLILDGYGAYGSSSDPYFSSVRLSLLDRGIILAIAHIRGGGENGRKWYEDGKLLNKKNTFTDFIDCGEYLVNHKYTSLDRMIARGGSAGGLLVGFIVNMRPDLFAAIIAGVPFVDLINTMLDESIPLTTYEFEEWGNPKEKEYFDYMLSYSPYDNIKKQDYPNMLITAGLNDARVAYWESLKWTAKLREYKTDNNTILLKMDMGSGHGGSSGRYDFYRDIAFEYGYIIDIFGLNESISKEAIVSPLELREENEEQREIDYIIDDEIER